MQRDEVRRRRQPDVEVQLLLEARLGRSTRDRAERLREQLDRLEAPMLGIVAWGLGFFFAGFAIGILILAIDVLT